MTRLLEFCPEYCGNEQNPGIGTDDPYLVDYSAQETTPDQRRIEAELERGDLSGKTLLHVGVGNSGLAQCFATRLARVNGVTVSANELTAAQSLGIANYTVWLTNKFGAALRAVLRADYDFIVDNNLNGFACCRRHFCFMLTSYCMFLKRSGRILTDQRGMDWTAGDPRRRLTYSDLASLETWLPVRVSKLSETVYSIQSIGEWNEPRVRSAEAGI